MCRSETAVLCRVRERAGNALWYFENTAISHKTNQQELYYNKLNEKTIYNDK
jgi:hypothetical protein